MKFNPEDIQSAVAGELEKGEHNWPLSENMVADTSQLACPDVNLKVGKLLSGTRQL